MEIFWKAAAVIVLTVILEAAVRKSEKDIAAVLSVTACCIVMTVAMQYLWEVITFFRELAGWFSGSESLMERMLKVSAVALVTELTSLISADAGNSSLGKAANILGNAAILYLSVPLLDSLLQIIQEITGNL